MNAASPDGTVLELMLAGTLSFLFRYKAPRPQPATFTQLLASARARDHREVGTARLDDLESDARNVTDLIQIDHLGVGKKGESGGSEVVTAWPRRPKPEISTSSFSSMKFKHPSLRCCISVSVCFREKSRQQNDLQRPERSLTEVWSHHIYIHMSETWAWCTRNVFSEQSMTLILLCAPWHESRNLLAVLDELNT